MSQNCELDQPGVHRAKFETAPLLGAHHRGRHRLVPHLQHLGTGCMDADEARVLNV